MSCSTRHITGRGAPRIAPLLAVMLAAAVLPGVAEAQLAGFIKKKIGEQLGRGSSEESAFAALDEGAVPAPLLTLGRGVEMGALGCSRAVLLDGGISGQLAPRDSAGRAHRWRGLRRVPMGLVAIPRRGG